MSRFTQLPEVLKDRAKFEKLGLDFDYKDGAENLRIFDKDL
jgi:hypothetical protein